MAVLENVLPIAVKYVLVVLTTVQKFVNRPHARIHTVIHIVTVVGNVPEVVRIFVCTLVVAARVKMRVLIVVKYIVEQNVKAAVTLVVLVPPMQD